MTTQQHTIPLIRLGAVTVELAEPVPASQWQEWTETLGKLGYALTPATREGGDA